MRAEIDLIFRNAPRSLKGTWRTDAKTVYTCDLLFGRDNEQTTHAQIVS
jgi:hypothetical protein